MLDAMNGQLPLRQPCPPGACDCGREALLAEPHGDIRILLLTRQEEQRLVQRLEQLKAENRLLRANEKSWREERAHLIEKNELARHKVEAMILRLKALEQDS